MIRTYTIDRPHVRNALDLATIDAIAAMLVDPARVFVLTGAGEKVFCSGADLAEVAGSPEGRRDAARRYARLLGRISACERPVVARVNGHCLAGGMGLLLACDLAVAADDVTFSLPEAAVGMWPMMVGAYLLRTVPRKVAMELAMTGRKLTAAEAHAYGLVNRVVPRAELDGAVAELTASLLRQSPSALKLGKRAWRDALDRPLDDGLGLLAERLGDLMATEDAAEGFVAFLQKRAPEWKDR
ncbi:MAG: enoyl-CoA hydratase/isomerase family protein [Myxococcota bacterium]